MANNRNNKAIEDLCTSYSAYMAAIREQRDQAITAWAICLLADQKNTGVIMIPMDRLYGTIELRKELVKEMY